MGSVFGGGGKKQAKAIKKASQLEAAAAREAARGAQLTQETMLAQDRASRAAADLLSRPQGEVEVDLLSRGDDEIDPATGRRRNTRQSYSKAIQI